ncbi:hypothetical protein FKW77_010578 [Venturia effusa]|uniref:Uncharacterized protein n=1 Tax=Venturia effusa TaxID=50376 RepID=A0A517KXW1_9PEZI|nr:hypothetical protein FKW77_010578 [Venturia effusa]
MRLLPNEWEGAHPLLPRTPDTGLPIAIILNSAVYGSFLGLSYGLGRKAFTKVFYRKHYQQVPQQPYPLWRTIGAFTGWTSVCLVSVQAWNRHQKKKEASIILNDAGIPMPRFKLWEHTTKPTLDDLTLTIGLATVISSLARQRFRPASMSGVAIMGQASVSMAVGRLGLLAWGHEEYTSLRDQYNHELDAASKSYTARYGKPPPRILYGTYDRTWSLQSTSEESLNAGQQSNLSLTGLSSASSTGSEPEGPHYKFADGSVAEPQPRGSHPHTCVLINGSLVFGPMRDYFWEPESVQRGTEILKAHLEKLNEKRTKLVQEAAFLFQEVAQRENNYLALSKNERETEAGRKSRKAMELLSSMHSNTYFNIAEVDWLISDSKKWLLQLESNGTWMPRTQGSPDPKAVEAILENIRKHKKSTDMMLQQIGSMVVPPENRSEIEQDVRDVKENSEATADLIDHFDPMTKPNKGPD